MKPLPTLRQLRYLVAVAEHRHFGRAAQECNVTQSTLSAGLQELEAILGVSLVSRSQRHIALTPVGEEIIGRAQALLRAAEDIADIAQAGNRPLQGLVRLGVIPTIAPYLLPRALPAIRVSYPQLRLYLREEQTASALALVAKRRLDAALIALPYDVGAMQWAVIGEERLMVACPGDHALVPRTSLTVDDLKGQPLLLLEDGHCLRDHALTACGLKAGQSNEVFQATSMGTLMQMVASGLGITLMPEMAVAVETGREASVTAIPLEGTRAVRTIALCWTPGSPRARDFTLLATELRPFVATPVPTPADSPSVA